MTAPLQALHARTIGGLDREITMLEQRLTVLKSWRLREKDELVELRKRAEQRAMARNAAALRLPPLTGEKARRSQPRRVS